MLFHENCAMMKFLASLTGLSKQRKMQKLQALMVWKIKLGAALNHPDPATFYSQGAAGYTDYPTLSSV